MIASKDMPPDTGGFGSMMLHNQFLNKPHPAPAGTDLTGQVAIITGASSGLGLECARQLLTLGLSHLIIAVRSEERGKKAAAQLQPARPSAKIEVWGLEMESYKSVQAFAERCNTDLSRLDVVMLNAGLTELEFSTVPETGHEKVMQVNYYSTMLLAILLLPVLKVKSPAGKPGRVSVVNSGMSDVAKLPNRDKRPFLGSFDDTKITPWDNAERYSASKLLGQFFLSRLAGEVSSDNVVINMVEPGLTKGTSLFRKAAGLQGLVFNSFKAMTARTPEVGAWTYVDVAVVQGKDSHGSYFVNCKPSPFGRLSYGPEGQKVSDALWEETLQEFEFAGARPIISSMAT